MRMLRTGRRSRSNAFSSSARLQVYVMRPRERLRLGASPRQAEHDRIAPGGVFRDGIWFWDGEVLAARLC